ncbi:MAG: hypothetical protein ACTSQ8_26330, partial [Candidatus Helarchaeota archaeon]
RICYRVHGSGRDDLGGLHRCGQRCYHDDRLTYCFAVVPSLSAAGGVDDSGHPVEAVVKKENTVTKSEKYKELRKSFITISGYNMGLLLSIIRIAGG